MHFFFNGNNLVPSLLLETGTKYEITTGELFFVQPFNSCEQMKPGKEREIVLPATKFDICVFKTREIQF